MRRRADLVEDEELAKVEYVANKVHPGRTLMRYYSYGTVYQRVESFPDPTHRHVMTYVGSVDLHYFKCTSCSLHLDGLRWTL